MRTFFALIMTFMLSCSLAFAGDNTPEALDKISFKLTAKQWISTSTALVSVSINASLKEDGLVKARQEIMTKLQEIAKADWHITQFERSQDSSGLEKLYVNAQARVDQSFLSSIFQQAKKISQPGTNYRINNIEFKPSLEEMQKGRTELRETLYEQVKAELQRINKIYPQQHYSVNRLIFVDGDAPMPTERLQRSKMNGMMATMAAAPAIALSNELKMTAMVVAASMQEKD